MRRFLFIFIITIVSSCFQFSHEILAQGRTIDSLLVVLKKSRGDTSKVSTLVALAKHYRTVDSVKALKTATMAIRLAERLKDERLIASASCTIAEILLDRLEFNTAEERFRMGLNLSRKTGDRKGQARALEGLCAVQIKQRQDDEGLPFIKQALEIYDQLNDTIGIAGALCEIGRIHQRRDRYTEALPFFQRRLQIEEKVGRKAKVAVASLEYGQVLCSLGRPKEAAPLLHKSLVLSQGIRNADGIAKALLFLGHAAYFQSKLDTALYYYGRALGARENMKDVQGAMLVRVSIGNVYLEMDRVEAALEYFQKALPFYEEWENKNMNAYLLGNIGRIHFMIHQYPKALDFCNRSLRIYEETKSTRGIATITRYLANIMIDTQRFEEALEYHKRCLAMQELMGNEREISSQHSSIGSCLKILGRDDQAMEAFRKAIAMDGKRGEANWIANNLNEIGSLYKKKGMIDSALAYCLAAYNLYKDFDPDCSRRYVASNLSALYERKEDFGLALRYHKEYFTLVDSVLNETNLKSINEMMVKYDRVRQEQQIALLEKEKALQTSELERKQSELEVQYLKSEQSHQRAEFLSQQKELQSSELERSRADLALSQSEKKTKENEIALLSKEAQLKDSIRNALLSGLILFLIIGLLAFKRVQGKRREAALRAEAAEYHAKAAEAQSLSVAIEAERQQKEMQQQFSRKLMDSQEQERKRIAGELHDGIGQDLLIIKHRVMLAMDDVSKQDEHLQEILDISGEAIDDVRRISRDLRPYQLERVGLTGSLNAMLSSVAESTSLNVHYSIDPLDGLIPTEQEINVYRVVQEGLNNIIKHADAKNAEVLIKRQNGVISITICDDGKGFDQTDITSERLESGLGLMGMGERIKMMDGSYTLDTSPGQGMRFHASIPMQKQEQTEVLESNEKELEMRYE